MEGENGREEGVVVVAGFASRCELGGGAAACKGLAKEGEACAGAFACG